MLPYALRPMREFPDGPWTSEPNSVEFQAHGLECAIVRHPYLGHLCGYAAVPTGHHLYTKNCEDFNNIEVHGGLTFSEKDDFGNWWFGFDCAHYMDRGAFDGISPYAKYRDLKYVRTETENLARQLQAIPRLENMYFWLGASADNA